MVGLVVIVICVLIAIPAMSIWALSRSSAARDDVMRLARAREEDRIKLDDMQRQLRRLEARLQEGGLAASAVPPPEEAAAAEHAAEGPKGAPQEARAEALTEAPDASSAAPASDGAAAAAQAKDIAAPAADPAAGAGADNDAPSRPMHAAARVEDAGARMVWPSGRKTRARADEGAAQTGGGADGGDKRGATGGSETFDKAVAWVSENWFLAAAAASLMLAGLFLIQYSAQHGLLSPAARIIGALGLGLALIGGGEVIRRRMGADGEDATGSAADYLPSTFAGAGLFTLFGAFVAARHMYALIGPLQAFAGLAATALLAVLLGWFYGPLLAAAGILAAAIVPFVVGGGTGPEPVLFAYYAVLALAALGVDTFRRWAWVSGIGVGAGVVATFLLWAGWSASGDGAVTAQVSLWFLATLMVIAVAAAVVPKRSAKPVFAGALLRDPQARLFVGAVMALVFGALAVPMQAAQMPLLWIALAALALVALGAVFWLKASDRLAWLLALPMGAFALVVIGWADRYAVITRVAKAAEGSEAQMRAVTEAPRLDLPLPALLLAVAVVYSLLAFVQMRRSVGQGAPWRRAVPQDALPDDAPFADRLARSGTKVIGALSLPMVWALAAASFAPVIAGLLELIWRPVDAMGRGPWALAVMALAAVMVLLTERALHSPDGGAQGGDTAGESRARSGAETARHGGSAGAAPAAHQRAALFAIAALSMISLSLTVMLSDLALSVSLAVMVGLAALADRKLNLPALAVFAQAGTIIIGTRLVSEALDLSLFGPVPPVGLGELLLWSGATMALLFAAWKLLAARDRSAARITIESALFVLGAVLAAETIRVLWGNRMPDHAEAGLNASMLLVLLGAQLWRLQIGGTVTQWVRRGLAGLFATLGGLSLFASGFALNPLWNGPVAGPFLADSAAVGLLLPALILLAIVLRIPAVRGLKAEARAALYATAGTLAGFYAWIELRRLWHGRDVSFANGVAQSEMYAYTVLMLIAAAGMFYVAFGRRSDMLRKVATGLVAVTIAKVFFLDVGGLDGLWRVASFLGLGLALGALAWLTRLMQAQWERGSDPDPQGTGEGGGRGPAPRDDADPAPRGETPAEAGIAEGEDGADPSGADKP